MGFWPWLPHEKSPQNPFLLHPLSVLFGTPGNLLLVLLSGHAQLCLCRVSQSWAQKLISFLCNTFISRWGSQEPASVFSECPEKPEKLLKSLDFTKTCEEEGIGLRATVLCWQPSSNKSPSPNLLQLPTAKPGLGQGRLGKPCKPSIQALMNPSNGSHTPFLVILKYEIIGETLILVKISLSWYLKV